MSHQELEPVMGGKSESAIIWWSKGDGESPAFAAEEIRGYVNRIYPSKITVGKIPVPCGDPLDHLTCALVWTAVSAMDQVPAEWLREANERLAALPEDSYVIEAAEDRFFLASTNERALLYAAYELLERMGIRFLAPEFPFYEGHAEYVPARSSIITPPFLTIRPPSLKYRRKYVEEGWSHTPASLIRLVDWMAKNRINILVYPRDYLGQGVVRWEQWRHTLIPELKKRGIMLESGGHGYDSFLPESVYRSGHPEWFAEPDAPAVHELTEHRPANVFYISREDALQTYIENVVAYLKQHPEISIFDAWPPDGAVWPKSEIDRFGSIPNAQAYVTNKLSAAVRRALPGVKIETIAYVPSTDPPDPAYMYDESVIVDFAPYDRSYAERIYEPSYDKNVYYNTLLARWRDAGFQGDVCIYEYYAKYSWHSLPVLLPDMIFDEIPHYSDTLKVKGLGIYSEPANWITYEINHLLAAALSWAHRLDKNEWLENYLRLRFGGAAETMRRYYALMEEAGRTLFDRAKGNYSDLHKVSKARDLYLQALTVTEEAVGLAGGDDAFFFLERIRLNLAFAIADTEISYYGLLGDSLRRREAEIRTKELVDRHGTDGIILQSVWTLCRYLPVVTELPGRIANEWVYGMYREKDPPA